MKHSLLTCFLLMTAVTLQIAAAQDTINQSSQVNFSPYAEWESADSAIARQNAYSAYLQSLCPPDTVGLLDWTCSYTQDGRIDTLARYDEGILRSLLVGDSCFVSNDTLWHQAHAVLYYPSGCIEAEYDYRWADGDDPEIDWGYESNKKSYPDSCAMTNLTRRFRLCD